MKSIAYIGLIAFLIILGCNISDLKEIKTYYNNGNLKELRQYNKKNELNGEFKAYHLNGKLCTKAKFINDIQVDTTFNYLSTGSLDAIAIYDKQGKKMKEISYYANGKINVMRSFFVGSGQISAIKVYFENGTLDESNSDFTELQIYGKNYDSIRAKLHNCDFKDSIQVNIVKSFNYQFDFDAKIIRTMKFSKTKDLTFKLLKSDFIKNKVNIQIIAQKWVESKLNKENSFPIQISKGTFPRDNVDGIYRVY